MKTLKKGMSVLTFLFAIVALVFICNTKAYAASVKTMEATDTANGTSDDDTNGATDDNVTELPEEDSNTGSDENTPEEVPDKTPDEGDIEDTGTTTETDVHKYDSQFKKVSMPKAVTKAKGLQWKLTLSDIPLHSSQYTVKWTSSNKKAATVSVNGYVTTKSAGKAVITAKITCDNKATYTYKTTVTVSDPHFGSNYYGISVGGKVNLNIKGTKTTDYKLKIKNTSIINTVSGKKNRVKGYKLGQSEVTCSVDGKTIKCKVYVTNPKMDATDVFVVKGSSQKIKIKGWSGKTKPEYQSSNTKVATINQNGQIKGKKNGSCIVTVTVDNKKLSCYVAVSNKTVVNTLKSAYKGLGCTYSQARRMSKNYYDCSSFTWRNYSKYGVYFGSKNYAPTAADEAYNMVKTKKAIAYKTVSTSKLEPGDVIFIKNSSSNGRYRNIGHVVIYMGNGRIIHATPPKVCISNLSRYNGRVAVVSRPTK